MRKNVKTLALYCIDQFIQGVPGIHYSINARRLISITLKFVSYFLLSLRSWRVAHEIISLNPKILKAAVQYRCADGDLSQVYSKARRESGGIGTSHTHAHFNQ